MIQLPKTHFPGWRRTRGWLSIPGLRSTPGWRRYRQLVYVVLVLIMLWFSLANQSADQPVPKPQISASQSEYALVTEVIDGDTIKIDSGETIRYIGIDTPETKHPQKGVECFGEEASKANAQLVLGMRVRLDSDVSNTDRYGRLLRYVYLDDIFVNEYLVRRGFAHATAYPPDIKYQDTLESAEQSARIEEIGLWEEGVCEKKRGAPEGALRG